jgi:heat shock protein HslJ
MVSFKRYFIQNKTRNMDIFRFLCSTFLILLVVQFSKAQISIKNINTDGVWIIKEITVDANLTKVTEKNANVVIDSKKKTILVYVGCNRITSNLEFVTGDMIKPMVITSGGKNCKDKLTELEDNLTIILKQTNSVRKNGKKLEFYKGIELLMVLEREPEKK